MLIFDEAHNIEDIARCVGACCALICLRGRCLFTRSSELPAHACHCRMHTHTHACIMHTIPRESGSAEIELETLKLAWLGLERAANHGAAPDTYRPLAAAVMGLIQRLRALATDAGGGWRAAGFESQERVWAGRELMAELEAAGLGPNDVGHLQVGAAATPGFAPKKQPGTLAATAITKFKQVCSIQGCTHIKHTLRSTTTHQALYDQARAAEERATFNTEGEAALEEVPKDVDSARAGEPLRPLRLCHHAARMHERTLCC